MHLTLFGHILTTKNLQNCGEKNVTSKWLSDNSFQNTHIVHRHLCWTFNALFAHFFFVLDHFIAAFAISNAALFSTVLFSFYFSQASHISCATRANYINVVELLFLSRQNTVLFLFHGILSLQVLFNPFHTY